MNQNKQSIPPSLIMPLTHLALLRVSGADAESFLQGQLTCDVGSMSKNSTLLAAFCTPKGRAIASFQIIRRNEDYLLLLSRDLVEKVMSRLKMFILRSAVSIEALVMTHSLYGMILQEGVRSLPNDLSIPEAGHSTTTNDSTIIRIKGTPPRLILITEGKPDINKLEITLTNDLNKWLLLDIINGLPLVTASTSEAYIPQMFNLDILGGIGFKKGCYTGQEIIARMHYLGKLKQRTFLASAQCTTPLEPGTPIHDGDQKIGSILMAARAEDNKTKLLVVMQITHSKSDNIYLENNPDIQLIFEDLPYTLDS